MTVIVTHAHNKHPAPPAASPPCFPPGIPPGENVTKHRRDERVGIAVKEAGMKWENPLNGIPQRHPHHLHCAYSIDSIDSAYYSVA
jgi:hypothetical protein